MTDKNQQPQHHQPATPRPYMKPKLTEYGNVRDFTRGGGGSKADKQGPQA